MELWLTFVRTNRRLGVFDVDAAEGRIALWGVPIEMRPDAPPEAVPEDLAKLEQCAHFLARLAVGGGEPADWARLRRMYVALESDGSQRVKALEAIERTQATVAAGGDLGAEAKLLTLALAMVHPAFERLDVRGNVLHCVRSVERPGRAQARRRSLRPCTACTDEVTGGLLLRVSNSDHDTSRTGYP
jgi:hypothetical protein